MLEDNCQFAVSWFLKRTLSKSPNCSFLLFSPESFPPRHTLTITTETHQTPTIGPGSIHARTFRTGLHSRPNPYHSQALRLKSGRLDEIHRVFGRGREGHVWRFFFTSASPFFLFFCSSHPSTTCGILAQRIALGLSSALSAACRSIVTRH